MEILEMKLLKYCFYVYKFKIYKIINIICNEVKLVKDF